MENLDKNMPSKEKISQPPERKYWKLISEEPAFVTNLSVENPSDIDWYEKVDRSPEVNRWMKNEGELPGGIMTKEEIEDVISRHPKDWLLYAVSGGKSEEELEGWIQIWPEEKEKVKRIKEKFSKDIPKNNLVLELSYARYKDPDLTEEEWEKRERGIIYSGIRQTCYLLGLQLTKENAKTKASKKPILKPKLSFVAYTDIDPVNISSEKVLEKSGFKIVGKIKYEPDSEKEDNFWVLDWNELSDFYAKKDEERMKITPTETLE